MPDTGFVIAGTGADDDGVGSVAWNSPGNVTSDDGSNASVRLSSGQISHYLKATNYADLPADVTIDGIEVQVESDIQVGSRDVLEERIRLVDEVGAIGTTDRSTASAFPDGGGLVQWGAADDLWGDTWSKADLEDNDSGFVIAATRSGAFNDLFIDAAWRKIYYTEAAPSIALIAPETNPLIRL